MGELDRKEQDRAAKDERKRRADVDDQDGSGDGTHLMPWDADVEEFLQHLERALRDFRVSMGSSEFHALVVSYRQLSPAEKRAVSNKLQKRRLSSLLRALHAGDYRM